MGSSASRYGGVLVNVIDVHQHPLYESTFDYDFSILQLERVQLPSSVGFVKLPSFFDTTIAGELTFVSGWGDTKNDNESLHFLRGVEVPVADFNKCQEAYSKMRLAVTDRMICAGYSAGGNLLKRFQSSLLKFLCCMQASMLVRATAAAQW